MHELFAIYSGMVRVNYFFPFSLVDVDYFSVSVVDCFIFKNS
jgi:hypothetical protein